MRLRVCTATVATVALLAPVAHAAFSGRRGLIAFSDGGGSVYSPGSCDMDPASCEFPSGHLLTISERGRHRRILDVCQRKTACAEASAPAWDPHGHRLAFDTDKGVGITDAQGRNLRLLSYAGNGTSQARPAWSPDGRQIAVEGVHRHRDNLFILDVATGRSRELPVSRAINPDWSIRGWIVFERYSASFDRNNVWMVRPSGRGLRRLTFTGGHSPSWSPHGTEILYVRPPRSTAGYGADEGDLFVLNPRTRRRFRVTRQHAADGTWSPDGKYVAFVSDPCSSIDFSCPDIFISSTRGGHVRQITRDGNSQQPAWRPTHR